MHPPPARLPDSDLQPRRAADTGPLCLVLPRTALDASLASWLAPDGAGASATAAPVPHASQPRAAQTRHAPLVLQPESDRVLALAGPLQPGPPLRLPVAAHRAPAGPVDPLQRPWPTGLLLLHLAPADAMPPDAPTGPGWDHWLAHVAPAHRLASPALQADLLVCWLRADGQVRLVFCPGDGWARLHLPAGEPSGLAAPSPAAARWLPVPELWLPGPDLLRLRVDARTGTATEPMATAAPPAATAQLAAALGPAVLRRWQRCCFGIVGAGRAGSVLAHSLLRSGASVRVVDPDTMSAHSLDGDLPAGCDGQPKVQALAQQLRGLARPGAVLDGRRLPVASAAAGWMLAGSDIVVAAVDNDAAALWANAWALALLKPLLVVATGMHPHGAEADLRLLPPGSGCLACVGGFSQRALLPAQLDGPGLPLTDAAADAAADNAAAQRNGSLRSWGLLATHTGLRMLEQMAAGQLRGALFRRMTETADGGLQVQDWAPPQERRPGCPVCNRLLGAGMAAVTPQVLRAAVQAMPTRPEGSALRPPAR